MLSLLICILVLNILRLSKSCRDARREIQSYCGASAGPSFSGSMQDLRCYSASYASSVYPTQTQMGNTGDVKFKKGRIDVLELFLAGGDSFTGVYTGIEFDVAMTMIVMGAEDLVDVH
ncbi:hypothetical protein K2173_011720 [Erythroxylum novogranatense]|uniref:Uncharacterized protein n=1 Tax=Erythroxylum novogranatense TaxID=1862640 RepID=A0AAV8TJ20_9ROSI|nr:hypothetical protein K2173_011720 [Erythroxylum novogranatense]